MKNLKLARNILVFSLVCLVVMSCDGLFTDIDAERVYDGPQQVAFKFQSDQVNEGSGTYTLEVQLIRAKSGTLEQALDVSFVVVGESTTATDSDYDIVTPSPVTIPAGSLKTNIQLTFNGTAIPDTLARTLTLKLTGNESRGVKGAEELGQFELTIVGQ